MNNYIDELEARMISYVVKSTNGLWDDRDEKGNFLSIEDELNNLNAAIFKEIACCRELGIHPNESRKYRQIISSGEKRFENCGFGFTGIIFQKVKRKRVKKKANKKGYYIYR